MKLETKYKCQVADHAFMSRVSHSTCCKNLLCPEYCKAFAAIVFTCVLTTPIIKTFFWHSSTLIGHSHEDRKLETNQLETKISESHLWLDFVGSLN